MNLLAIYDWDGEIGVWRHPGRLVRLMQNAGIAPNWLTICERGSNVERCTEISSTLTLRKAIANSPDFEWLALDHVVDGDFSNALSHAVVKESDSKKYTMSLHEPVHQNCRKHLIELSRYIRPKYGFVISMSTHAAIIFSGGGGTVSMDYGTRATADALMHRVLIDKMHLEGFVVDVFGINILSAAHMKMRVGSGNLWSWIEGERVGTLTVITPGVFLWEVAESLRSQARLKLREAGILVSL